MAAVLACGRDAGLSHETAAALWDLQPGRSVTVHVSIAHGTDRRIPGVRVHRTRRIPGDLTRRDGIPVTTPLRTLLDIAACLPSRSVEIAVNAADRLGLLGIDVLRAELDSRRGERGVGVLRGLLDARTFRLTDSELERRFLRIVESAGLSLPETGVRLNGFTVDFYWPALGLVVETDGLTYHRTPEQQEHDHRRDQAHSAAGMTCLRFTHAQIRHEPGRFATVLARVIARLARAS